MSMQSQRAVTDPPDQARSGSDGKRGVFGRLFHHLTTDAQSLDAEDLESTAVKAGAECCRDIRQGDSVRVVGRLRSVVYTPNDMLPTLEAELFDGTGSLKLVWLGQRQISGIEPGRKMAVEGRIADRKGERTMFNPWYELAPSTG